MTEIRQIVQGHTASLERRHEAGFTLIEMLITMFILSLISGIMLQAVMDMRRLNDQQSNRSEMHAGIRNATALLQQEVGQAGRMAFPVAPTLATAVGSAGTHWVSISPSTASMFQGLQLTIGIGDAHEIVQVLAVNGGSNQIQAAFTRTHAANTRITPAGGFAAGVVPTNMVNGSSASVLKIVGDINSDGNLVYVEYICDWTEGRMYRNMVPFNAASKPARTIEQVLLDNLLPNPADPNGVVPPCFNYQQQTINGRTYVVNVAIMTTVRTHDRDAITGQFQTVTKALLNVAPRNVFHVWQTASLGYENRIQPLPPTVLQLLP